MVEHKVLCGCSSCLGTLAAHAVAFAAVLLAMWALS